MSGSTGAAQLAGVLVLKTSQKTGPQLKDSSDRLGERGMELGTPCYKATADLSITPQQLAFCGCSLEVDWVYLMSGAPESSTGLKCLRRPGHG